MSIYRTFNLQVTGTPLLPQAVNFTDLFDSFGVPLPVFTTAPAVMIQRISRDIKPYLTEAPTTTGFKICRSETGDHTNPLYVNIIIMEDWYAYRVTIPVSITGTPLVPQTINYSSLTYDGGGAVTSSFDIPPVILIQSYTKDCETYLTEAPGLTSFKVARSETGDHSGNQAIVIYIISTAPNIFTNTGIRRTLPITISGLYGSEQAVLYTDLTDSEGETIQNSYTENPVVFIQSVDKDNVVNLTANPGELYFKVAKNESEAGTIKVSFVMFVSSDVPSVLPTETTLTLDEMLSLWGILAGDPDPHRYPVELRVKTLNIAQEKLCALINPSFVPEICTIQSAVALDTQGRFNTTALTYKLLNGIDGFISIKTHAGYFVDRIKYEEFRTLSIAGYGYNDTHPIAYPMGTYICIEPERTSVDLYYKRKPTPMYLMEHRTSSVSCVLNGVLHPIIVGLAVEAFVDSYPSAAEAYRFALGKINELNGVIQHSDTIRAIDRQVFKRGHTGWELAKSFSGRLW
jgi:hypothetical protein